MREKKRGNRQKERVDVIVVGGHMLDLNLVFISFPFPLVFLADFMQSTDSMVLHLNGYSVERKMEMGECGNL